MANRGKMTLMLPILVATWFLPFLPTQSTTTEPEHMVASTRGNNTCSIHCIPRERDALLAFVASLTVVTDPINYLSSWQGEDCCQWKGVRCSNHTAHVTELTLHNIGIREGQMNSSLLGLQHLTSLDLSDNNFCGAPIPQFIGGFKNLRYLNLSHSHFSGQVPPHLGNLSKLLYLDLDNKYDYLNNLYSSDLAWLSHLIKLRYLDLSYTNLSTTTDWAHVVNKLPSLVTLNLQDCGLQNIIPSPEHVNLTSLENLDVSFNDLSGPSPGANALFWGLPNILHLDMGYSGIQGTIPEKLGNSTSIITLYLHQNNLVGTIPRTFRSLHNLEGLVLYANNISGPLSVLLQRLSGSSLTDLSLSRNNLSGRLPDQLWHLSNLMFLNLNDNRLSGELPLGIGALVKLEVLRLARNNLYGAITESHLGKLTNLTFLELYDTSFAIVFRDNWVPPFKLDIAVLRSVKLGLKFPEWLRSQNSIYTLDIANTSISGPLPHWFWVTFSGAEYLDLSLNKISGMLSSTMFRKMKVILIEFSDNLLVGSIPKLPSHLIYLDLSKNNLSGSLPSDLGAPQLQILSLFGNSISGRIPFYLCQLEKLEFLDLSDNKLIGSFPNCEKHMKAMNSHSNTNRAHNNIILMLNINNNNLSGKFPTFICKCQYIRFLDLSYSQFSGILPTWIGDKLPKVAFLRLRSNLFFGNIPQTLVKLKSLQYLDLACNNISGTIPQSLANLVAMATASTDDNALSYLNRNFALIDEDAMIPFTGSSLVVTKGQMLEFTSGISYMVNLDLSCNILTGPIPVGIGKLSALKNLNISWNNLSGIIPHSIGGIHSLESLDLSHNEFGGEIPAELSYLLSLSHLNLSYNDLTGRIPSGNQLQTLADPASIYIGNPGLCGPPLSKNCTETNLTPIMPEGHRDRGDEIFFFLAVGSGYMMGLWTIFFLLLFNRNWRIHFFRFSDRMYYWVYVHVTLSLTWKEG